MVSPKRSRWHPNFFTLLTSLFHYLSMENFQKKRATLENFCANVLNWQNVFVVELWAKSCHLKIWWTLKSTSRSKLIEILLTRTSKTKKEGSRHFVNKDTLLRYSHPITAYISPLNFLWFLRVTASKDRAKLDWIDPKIKILKLCQNKAYHTPE